MNIVTYNLLAPTLATPTIYPGADPVALDPAVRVPLLLGRLGAAVSQNAIVCMQEVTSDLWSAHLVPFLTESGYAVTLQEYGKTHGGQLGVAIAWPVRAYQHVQTRSCPLVTTKAKWTVKSGHFPEDARKCAGSKPNQLLAVQLIDETTRRPFFLGTYHMPAMFALPSAMNMHAILASNYMHTLSGGGQMPYILAGDFNILPGSSTYQLLTVGALIRGHPEQPVQHFKDEWRVAAPMRSVYALANAGREPEFTNFAHATTRCGVFRGTLDYIFISNGLVPTRAVVDLRGQAGPFPSREEPSDHVPLYASLAFVSE